MDETQKGIIQINNGKLDELILIMQMSSYDANIAIDQSHDVEEIKALREHKKKVEKWLNRFYKAKSDITIGGDKQATKKGE